MRLQLCHTMEYTYSEPVILAPHIIRMRPRRDPVQHEQAYSLRIEPAPAGLSEGVDAEGNIFALTWFTGETSRLKFIVETTVNVTRTNPFDYLVVNPGELALPLPSRSDKSDVLTPYLYRPYPTPEVDRFALDIANAANKQTVLFLDELAARMRERFKRQIRAHGAPHPAHVTLQAGTGSCRDLAVLFIDACRALNLPARFVSGYWRGAHNQRHELHAWAEVYLSGGGWRAYDPVAGSVVVDAHIAVAAAARPAGAAPLEGSFFGTASAHMDTALSLAAI